MKKFIILISVYNDWEALNKLILLDFSSVASAKEKNKLTKTKKATRLAFIIFVP